MTVVHLSVFGPHTALEKWRVEKEHKKTKKNVFSCFCLLFLNLGFCHFCVCVFSLSLALECSLQAGVERTISR